MSTLSVKSHGVLRVAVLDPCLHHDAPLDVVPRMQDVLTHPRAAARLHDHRHESLAVFHGQCPAGGVMQDILGLDVAWGPCMRYRYHSRSAHDIGDLNFLTYT